jgi:HAD superfamily hydrolase (TIGR01509 family)
MTVRAIVFDIGGVLEFDPDLGVTGRWERALGLDPGGLDLKLGHLWAAGSIGTVTLFEVHQGIQAALGIDQDTVDAMMADIWEQYLGTLNVELYDYFRGLRPRHITGILSNSFVGAREREQALYGFEDACDLIVYSHEVGMSKPDERIYRLTCTRLGVRPEEMVFLDNHRPHVEAARALGINAVHYLDNAQAIAEIESYLC